MKSAYLLTSSVFLAIVLFGRWYFGWGQQEFAYLLLLYFLVTIGIRLDEIVKQIQITNQHLGQLIELKARQPEIMRDLQAPVAAQANPDGASASAIDQEMTEKRSAAKPPNAGCARKALG
jgi:hypothetical protein